MPPPPNKAARLASAFERAACGEDWRAAIQALDSLIRLMPQHAGLHYNRAVVLRRLGQAGEALAAARAALTLAPHHEGAQFEEAAALMDAGTLQEAARAFADLLERAPADADARVNLARCRLKLGEPASALAALGPSEGDSEAARAIRAEALRDAGDLDGAEALWSGMPAAIALKQRTHGARGRLPLNPTILAPRLSFAGQEPR